MELCVPVIKYDGPIGCSRNTIGKCSKILNTFLFLFSNKIFVYRARIHKLHVRIADREDPVHTASSEAG